MGDMKTEATKGTEDAMNETDLSVQSPERLRDTGRRAAYDQEARAFGGHWFKSSCTSPKLSDADLREMFDMAIEWGIENLLSPQYRMRARIVRPKLIRSQRRHDYCKGSFMRPQSVISMTANHVHAGRLNCLLHEVAHWFIHGGTPHGKGWKRCYVELVREFMGERDATRLAGEFGLLPRSHPQARTVDPERSRRAKARKTYLWEWSADGAVWHVCKRKDVGFEYSHDELWAKSTGRPVEAWVDGRRWAKVRATRR